MQAWFKAMILQLMIKLKYWFQFWNVNQKESFRSQESETMI